jgi:chemotaxis protein histidine kinase CheA
MISLNDRERWNKLVAEAIKQNSKEGEKMEKFQKVFELSFDDIRSKIYAKFDVNLAEDQYSWIVDTYDTYFIINIYGNGEDKYYKYNYTKNDSDVEIDFESKAEVVEERKWVELPEVQNLQAQLQEANNKVSEIEKQLNEVNEKFETATTEKNEIVTQFNEASEKIVTLNAQVEELKPFKENHETEQYEKALNEKKEYYSVKFEAVNAKEKFESEEIQNLIKLSIEDSEEGKNAVFSISQMLVDLVEIKPDTTKPPIKEFSSRLENLIPTDGSFDKRYSE